MNANRAGAAVAVGRSAEDALGPLIGRLRAEADGGEALGVEPGLVGTGEDWFTAAELIGSPHERLRTLIARTERRWRAPSHVAAALWWKNVSYWTALPVATGWALNRRVPLLTLDTTLLRASEEADMRVAVSELRVATGNDDDLGAAIAATLLRDVCAPLIDALHELTRAGRRGLWGSVAEALVYPLVTAAPGDASQAAALLRSVGDPVAGLVELPELRRRTCCLWVTLPEADACPTCCVIGGARASG
ncbi:(2Fe-2S)-binding protein [Thermomonospora umbrina]|uniref:FhuF-like iron-sulfur protein n=1 Tax=Thermomonospora umbrina TaxID=111806 RepID=A0A3D9SW02_9ACTN|nr:(2Fe-2S)-binding protein [Thermomonospora umbrina]REE99998.1 hypothetical protein DFJ69_5519 [Thermomonospora umbrina]